MKEERILANIVQIRTDKRLSKREVAEMMCMTEANYGRIENGKIALSYRHLAQLASALNISVLDIITYPDKYVKYEAAGDEPVEAVLQIKLKKDKKDQVLRLVFGENNIEILNK